MNFNIKLIFKILYINITLIMAQSKYSYRGFMLDTARQFFPLSTIKTILDYMKEANLNKFHWHLIDNEGFNIEFNYDYKKLTNYGSLKGQYYTKKNIIEIINYAKKYNIEVIPEFDFPGHAKAFGIAYPKIMLKGFDDELDLSNPKVFTILDKLFTEFIPIFNTSEYVHFGHDESANIPTEIIKSLTFAAGIATKYNKTPIVWDDPITDKRIRQPPCQPFIVQVWQDIEALYIILNLEYKTIVSISKNFYIGNDVGTPKDFDFPDNENIIGFEICWFTSESDDTNDVSWIKSFMMETKDF
jgi:hypothetical protein